MAKRLIFPRENLIKYFTVKFQNFRLSTNGWYVFTCPVCGSDKGALNPDAQFMKCWKGCFRGYVSEVLEETFSVPKDRVYKEVTSATTPISLPTSLEMTNSRPDKRRLAYKKHNRIIDNHPQALPLPETFRRIDQATALYGRRAVNYLESRGFDIDYLASQGVGYCSGGQYMQRIIVPFYRNGICRYYQGRTFIDHPIKYFNPRKELVGIGKEDIIYNEDALYMFPKVYIMEGALDALSIGEDATSTQGWNMSRWQQLKYMNAKAKELVFIPDCGKTTAGTSYYTLAVRAALAFLRNKRVKVIDTNRMSMFGKDVNEIGWSRLSVLEDDTPYIESLSQIMELL